MVQQRSGSDKESSKSQSRKVGPTKKAPTKAGGRGSGSKLTVMIVGIVLVAVVVLIVVAVTSSSSTTKGGGNAYTPLSATQVRQVTQIPASVYDTVGVTSSVAQVTPPTAVNGQPPLLFATSTGASKPGVFYFGAEYCPYCAAERWAVTAALSRFGPIEGLGLTSSSSSDVYPNTPSVTFAKASFNTTDIAVKAIERFTNIPLANGQGYTDLQFPNAEELGLINKYDSTTYIPSTTNGSIPFIDIGNAFLVSGASFSPAILNGLNRDQIAAGLSDPTNPATQAIIATANYLTASICKTTGGSPGNVCQSKGVKAAASAMKISY